MRGAARVHLIGLRQRRRRALRLEAPARADPPGAASSRVPDLVDPRLHRRARHLADRRRGIPRARSRAGAREAGNARIGTVIGRYFAMDRDKRWERIQQAYDLLVHGTAAHHVDVAPGRGARRLRARRDRRVHHRRRRVGAEALIRPGDSVVAFNFRPDRMREITRALAEPGVRRVRPRRRAARRALRDADRVRRGLAVPGRLPARAPAGHAAAGDRARRRQAAARRRDREVPARDVLLRRRRGGARGRRAARARRQPARRRRPTTTSRR